MHSVEADLDDDEFLTNGDKIARGATNSFTPNGSGPVPFTTSLDSSGCVTVDLSSSVTWQIKLRAEATVDGNTFDVRDSQSGDAVWVGWLETAWTPTTGTHTMDTNLHDAWNIMAAASFAMEVRDGGLSGRSFSFFTEDCPDVSGASCERFPDIFIAPAHADRKYVIVHELGHAVMEMCNNERNENNGDGGTGGSCDGAGGTLALKEYQSNAANEGVAWYYAAVVFNHREDDDCEFGRSLDYNKDGQLSVFEEFPSCEGDPVNEPWANLDFLGNECTGTLTGRAVRFDYVRAFWDLTQNAPGNGQGRTFDDVCDLWLEARPDTWDPDGGGIASDDPPDRLRQAADDLNFLNAWDNVDNANGIHR